MLLIATLFSLLHFAFSECTDLTFTLTDSYGDGWNGAYLNVTGVTDSSEAVRFDDGTVSTTVLCVSGTVTIDFVGGVYDHECGYTVSYSVGGDVVDVLTVDQGTEKPSYKLVKNGGSYYYLCPTGTYASDHNSCESCPVGKYSNAGASSCTSECPTGTYDFGSACESCPAGKYDHTSYTSSLSGLTALRYCASCPAGTSQPLEGQTYCGTCTAGMYSTGGQSSCELCPAGKYDHPSFTSYCGLCTAGRYSPEGQSSCGTCPSGKSSTVGQAACYIPIPNAVEGDRSLGIWQAADSYETQATIAKYGPIEYWDTSRVTSMASLFSGSQFNNDISKWNTGAVTSMIGMFVGATAFNSDISKWDTGAVTDMVEMFSGAIAFNSDISKWDVSKVTDMIDMFKDSGFKRPLCGGRWSYQAMEWMVEGGAFYRCCDFEPCRMCEAGEYASAGSSCTACPAGKFSRPESLDSSDCFALSLVPKTQLKAAYSTYSTC